MRLWKALKAFWKVFFNPETFQENTNDQKQLEKSSDELSHLRLLSLLQHSGRFIDFLKEDLSSYEDASIGASLRPMQKELAKLIEEIVTIRPILEEKEGESFTVPLGYDPQKIKVIGNVKGSPPYKGVIVHQGWKAHKRSLPKVVGKASQDILAPSEVEVI